METLISNKIYILDPTPEIIEYCKSKLVISNPDYEKKRRMGKWLGGTPQRLVLYERDGGTLALPFGCLRELLPLLRTSDIKCDFSEYRRVDYHCSVPLFDYQKPAVDELVRCKFGILESPAGSGKTQMGVALIARLGCKTLWLTHTADLLKQSMERAAMYMDPALFGTITEGKVNIGTGVTFATVQTLAAQDLNRYKYAFDAVIVDECHHLSGTPTMLRQFSAVVGALACRHKYGLTATLHRADKLERTVCDYLGAVAYSVPASAVADRIMNVTVKEIPTGIDIGDECLDTDGTIIYSRLVNFLAGNAARNQLIADGLAENAEHYNLVLSDRVEHLKTLRDMLPADVRPLAAVIDGTMQSKKAKAERGEIIEDMRQGRKRYLFATYKLAKEGLDIPRLDRLYLTTPQKDYTTIVQSVGRVARTFADKLPPVCYDYVDDADYFRGAFKLRCRHYKKCGCKIERSEQ